MKNILSYQQPLLGAEIKDWIQYHLDHQTEYSDIATRLERFQKIQDDEFYRVILNPPSSACGKNKRCSPDVVKIR